MIVLILIFITTSILIFFLKHYFGKWEVVDNLGNRIVRGSYFRCYSYWGSHWGELTNRRIKRIDA